MTDPVPSVEVDASSPVPPYEQVRSQIAHQVSSGELPAGARLPTVRQMAADLALAVNTVARAYRELEADGVIATHGRRGTFVRSDVLSSSSSTILELAATYTATARKLGLTQAEATRLVDEAWQT